MADRASSFEIKTGPCPGLGFADVSPDKDTVVAWLRGVDVKDSDGDKDHTDPRNHLGDPLHSSPVVVTYGDSADASAATEVEPDSLVFFGTNEGFLFTVPSYTAGTNGNVI